MFPNRLKPKSVSLYRLKQTKHIKTQKSSDLLDLVGQKRYAEACTYTQRYDEEQQLGKAVQFSQTKMLTLLSWGLKRWSVCVSLIYRTKVTLTARTD